MLLFIYLNRWHILIFVRIALHNSVGDHLHLTFFFFPFIFSLCFTIIIIFIRYSWIYCCTQSPNTSHATFKLLKIVKGNQSDLVNSIKIEPLACVFERKRDPTLNSFSNTPILYRSRIWLDNDIPLFMSIKFLSWTSALSTHLATSIWRLTFLFFFTFSP